MSEVARLINARAAGAPMSPEVGALADALIEALRPMMLALSDVVRVLADLTCQS